MSKKITVAVTGSSGYLAGCLMPLLEEDKNIKKIIGVDINEPAEKYSKLDFRKVSILETDELKKIFKEADCVVHMAFNINGMHNKDLLEKINVEGSRSVLKAVKEAGNVKKLVFTSSIAAYGAHRDNPVPLKEEHPLRGKGTFFYADQKHRLEEELEDWKKENPGISLITLRLSTTTGPKAYNETVTLYTAPVFVAFPFNQPPVQLLHEDDAAKGFHAAIVTDTEGAFNLGSDWKYSAKEHAKLAGTRIIIYLPVWLSRSFAYLLWWLRLVKFDPSWIQASLYPVVTDNTRAKKLLKWVPEFSSEQIIDSIKGKR